MEIVETLFKFLCSPKSNHLSIDLQKLSNYKDECDCKNCGFFPKGVVGK
jgi:hypothetical protein